MWFQLSDSLAPHVGTLVLSPGSDCSAFISNSFKKVWKAWANCGPGATSSPLKFLSGPSKLGKYISSVSCMFPLFSGSLRSHWTAINNNTAICQYYSLSDCKKSKFISLGDKVRLLVNKDTSDWFGLTEVAEDTCHADTARLKVAPGLLWVTCCTREGTPS